jgi:hypothetical protein
MKPIAFKYLKISAEKKKDIKEKITVNTHFSISNIEKEESFHFVEKDSAIFSFDFKYVLDYEDHASIDIKGKVYLNVDKKDAKDIEKEKRVADNVKEIIMNYIMIKTYVETLHLEEMLGLPFHRRAPQVVIEHLEEDKKSKKEEK